MVSVQQKDTTFTKIFVGGLPYHTTDDTLQKYFEQFGEIEEAVVITDRQTNKSRGYGFVTMADKTGAERACKDPNPVIDGRKANVNLAYLGAKPRGIPAAFPFALKTAVPGLLSSPLVTAGLAPQTYIYQPASTAGLYQQSGLIMNPAIAAQVNEVQQSQQPQQSSPTQAATPTQYYTTADYQAAYAQQLAALGYDVTGAFEPHPTAAAQQQASIANAAAGYAMSPTTYVTSAPTGYTYAALPNAAAAAGGSIYGSLAGLPVQATSPTLAAAMYQQQLQASAAAGQN